MKNLAYQFAVGACAYISRMQEKIKFCRSLTSNNAGTDHGWGSHAFVMGGAVKGGENYGTMPRLSKDSPDFWSDRLVPTTAMKSYLATVMKWFGASKSELDAIFPNLKRFSVRDMRFMT